MAFLEQIGKAVSKASRSKAVMGTVVAGAVVKGLSDTVGKSAINNAMEIAFDNPEADRAVLGTDLTPSLVLGEAGLGPVSTFAKVKNIEKYGVNPGIVGPIASVGAIGGAIGGLSGGAIGLTKGKGYYGKVYGGIAGTILGAIGGSVVGGAIGGGAAIGNAGMYMRENRQLLNQSPFSNSSLITADSLNASGDIVLGMHNSRRG